MNVKSKNKDKKVIFVVEIDPIPNEKLRLYVEKEHKYSHKLHSEFTEEDGILQNSRILMV